MLKSDDSSSSVDARDQNDDSAGGDGLSAFVGLAFFIGSFVSGFFVVSRVPSVILISESALGSTTED